MGSTRYKAYTDRDVKLMERVATQIAGAIANSRLYAVLKQTEESLRRNTDLLSFVIDNIPIAPYISEPEGDLGATYIGPSIESVTGYQQQEFA